MVVSETFLHCDAEAAGFFWRGSGGRGQAETANETRASNGRCCPRWCAAAETHVTTVLQL
jgi:hypothetical protein